MMNAQPTGTDESWVDVAPMADDVSVKAEPVDVADAAAVPAAPVGFDAGAIRLAIDRAAFKTAGDAAESMILGYEVPLSVVQSVTKVDSVFFFLVDGSGSMQGSSKAMMLQALRGLQEFAKLGRPDDKVLVAIFEFSQGVRNLHRDTTLTHDGELGGFFEHSDCIQIGAADACTRFDEVAKAYKACPLRGNTDMQLALDTAIRAASSFPDNVQKSIILCTDGEPNPRHPTVTRGGKEFHSHMPEDIRAASELLVTMREVQNLSTHCISIGEHARVHSLKTIVPHGLHGHAKNGDMVPVAVQQTFVRILESVGTCNTRLEFFAGYTVTKECTLQTGLLATDNLSFHTSVAVPRDTTSVVMHVSTPGGTATLTAAIAVYDPAQPNSLAPEGVATGAPEWLAELVRVKCAIACVEAASVGKTPDELEAAYRSLAASNPSSQEMCSKASKGAAAARSLSVRHASQAASVVSGDDDCPAPMYLSLSGPGASCGGPMYRSLSAPKRHKRPPTATPTLSAHDVDSMSQAVYN